MGWFLNLTWGWQFSIMWWQVKPSPATLALHPCGHWFCASCSTSDAASRGWWRPYTWETQKKFLELARSSPGCCGPLGSESAGRQNLSLPLSCNADFHKIFFFFFLISLGQGYWFSSDIAGFVSLLCVEDFLFVTGMFLVFHSWIIFRWFRY